MCKIVNEMQNVIMAFSLLVICVFVLSQIFEAGAQGSQIEECGSLILNPVRMLSLFAV